MPLLRRFLDANSRLSARLDQRKDAELYARYDAHVAAAIRALPAGAIVVDLGGGRHCSFAQHIRPAQNVRVVAVDISPAELAANTTVHETRVADVSEGLPFADAEVDLLVSRTVLEHVDGVEATVNHIARVLRPGGTTLHLLPCRYALFAIVARTVPFPLAKRILHLLIPSARGVVEFDVFYDHAHPRSLERIFVAAGFRQVDIECTWDQADYFHPVFPIFLLVLLYQRVAEVLGIRSLAAYAMVRAVR
ncbi:MAG: class I SAM-dependent methyltransferase [Solirubrobacteraceae bacterium]